VSERTRLQQQSGQSGYLASSDEGAPVRVVIELILSFDSANDAP